METNQVEDQDQPKHVMNIWEVNQSHLQSMTRKISEPPHLLSKVAGKTSCSIFRVPQSLVEINGNAYQPHIVSIGPYHRGQPHLRMIEEHKWLYLGSMLSRTKGQPKGLTLEDYLKAIEPLESKARDCYSENLHVPKDEFIEMMVLDGCFIIELFRKVAKLVPRDSDDPIFTMAWIVPFFYRDLLKFENQIPFFILERLFDLSKGENYSGPPLTSVSLQFFNDTLQRSDEIIEKYKDLECHHLLDLLRSSFIPHDLKEPTEPNHTPTHIIHCVSKLRMAGIKLRRRKEEDSFLVIKFKHGVLEMPSITIDDFMTSFLQNCVAYEQCHRSYSKHMTTYATLLDCLVNTYKDVEYLSDHNIIENYCGTDGDVAKFINNLGKDVAFDIDMCYLSKLFNDVHDYYQDSWNVYLASFKYTYFDTPWSFISALAAVVLLLLTLAQTYFTIISYVTPK